MAYKRKARVLFLCTGNSCRSQMAEGWARYLGGDWIEAQSAGIEAHGTNPRAIAVMREAGVDIANQESKRLAPEMLAWADLVVTVCGHADERCPALPPHVRKKHLPFEDPARTRGTEEEIMATFRSVRDEIRGAIEGILGGLRMMARHEEER